jgi:phage N-6-adenine-methyltransferase
LCPASNQAAQDKELPGVPCFTKETNGLTKEWRGRIWLNPPYSQPLIEQFTSKLVAEFKAGHVTEAIMLVNNATDTAWFHEAESVCAAICFTKGRIKFYNPDDNPPNPTQGNAFIYFGRNPKKFAKVFADVGFIR